MVSKLFLMLRKARNFWYVWVYTVVYMEQAPTKVWAYILKIGWFFP